MSFHTHFCNTHLKRKAVETSFRSYSHCELIEPDCLTPENLLKLLEITFQGCVAGLNTARVPRQNTGKAFEVLPVL